MNHFDPSYGYDLDALLDVAAPSSPADFAKFWQHCYQQTRDVASFPRLQHTGRKVGNFELFKLGFSSTDSIRLRGWVLIPAQKAVNRVLIVGHGYGGCDEPDGNVPLDDCAYIYMCYRGLARSHIHGIPADPNFHVLFNIDKKDEYILRGCVEDTWMAASVAEILFPWAKQHIGFMGISFSGGIGIMATPWDERIKMTHVQVPSFGNQPLRMTLPSWGSANAVQGFYKDHPEILDTLAYYDAATAAEYIDVPVHVAPALQDPVVAPPGQFAIYNNLSSKDKQLFVLDKGHSDYPEFETQQQQLMSDLKLFFKDL